MAKFGMNYEDLVEASGLDARTIRSIVRGEKQPHARTVQRLAEAFGESTEELFAAPHGMTAAAFDAATNPLVAEVTEARPQLFDGWSADDFQQLTSRFGVGGAMTAEGVVAEAKSLNAKRALVDRARVVLESKDAPLLASLIDLLYERVTSVEG